MNRVIEVRAPSGAVRIRATIDSECIRMPLTRGEVEELRDQLADRLMDTATDLRFLGTPKNRISVR